MPDPASIQVGADPLSTALALHRSGRLGAAVAVYRRLILDDPAAPHPWHLLGLVLERGGRAATGLGLIERAIRILPGAGLFHANRGVLLQALGRSREALSAFEAAIARQPDYAAAHTARAQLLVSEGRLAAATTAFRQALSVSPADAGTMVLFAELLRRSGSLPEALAIAGRAARLAPRSPEAQSAHADSLTALGVLSGAVEAYDRALALQPHFLAALSNRGLTLAELGRLDDAALSYRAALVVQPALAATWTNLAGALTAIGDAKGSARAAGHAIDIEPALPQPHRNLLVAQLYDPDLSHEQRFAARRRFEAAVARPLYPKLPPRFANPPDPGRRLKIGYLSADLRDHVVARAMLPLLQSHDRSAVEVFCYATAVRSDPVTASLRAATDHWRLLAGESDAAIAAAIRADGIDILVIIAAHFDQNRPIVCAYRPAPVQVSFLDVATTGFSAIDYIFTDARLLPRHSAERFAERPFRLPLHQVVAPPEGAQPPGPLPCLATGTVTFGSFNNPAKLTDATLALWARVLAAVPGSRLLLKYRMSFGEPSVRRRMARAFAAGGIDPARIEMLSSRDLRIDHLKLYDRVDIALDPFPFSGSSTSFEALWMGVPVVTLPGETMVGRWSAMMLRELGEDRLVAADEAGYVAACRHLAEDPDALAELRAGLRDRIAASRLCDTSRQARHLERAYRAMWRRWCAVQARIPPAPPPDLPAMLGRGVALQQAGRVGDAERLYRQLLRLDPALADGWNNLGILERQKGRLEAARTGLARQLRLRPTTAAWSAMGVVLRDLRQDEAARAAQRNALLLDPGAWQAHLNLGNLERSVSRPKVAAQLYRRAVRLAPTPIHWLALINGLAEAGRPKEALAAAEQACIAHPDHAELHLAVGLQRLLLGDLRRGWPDYEWRWKVPGAERPPAWGERPRWQGEDLAGRTILLQAEQGMGDSIQFLRYVPQVAARAAQTWLVVPNALRRLVADEEHVGILSPDEPMPAHDLQCPLMSLPPLLGTDTVGRIPAIVGYLRRDQAAEARWRDRLRGPGLAVGIAWAGNRAYRRDAMRSLDPGLLEPLLRIAGVRWFSLQVGPAAAQAAGFGDRMTDLAPDLADFAETAAAMAGLDLVVSVDTSVAHLGGAIGRPTWTLLPFAPSWRWLRAREDSPWYPSMRLYRQPGPGAWEPVVARVARHLARLART